MLLTGDLEISQRKGYWFNSDVFVFQIDKRSVVLFFVLVLVFTNLTQVRAIQEEGPLREKIPP